jgi:hypothetical protein
MGGPSHEVESRQLLAAGAEPNYYAEDTPPVNPTCRRSAKVSRATASRGGLRLGMTSQEVERLLGPPESRGDGYDEYTTDEHIVPPG